MVYMQLGEYAVELDRFLSEVAAYLTAVCPLE